MQGNLTTGQEIGPGSGWGRWSWATCCKARSITRWISACRPPTPTRGPSVRRVGRRFSSRATRAGAPHWRQGRFGQCPGQRLVGRPGCWASQATGAGGILGPESRPFPPQKQDRGSGCHRRHQHDPDGRRAVSKRRQRNMVGN